MKMATEKRQSFVEKKLEFLINVGDFESLRVGSTFGETIDWSTPEERQKKLDALTKNLAKEVAKDAQEVMLAYGLKRKSSAMPKTAGRTEVSGLDDIAEAEEADDEDFDL